MASHAIKFWKKDIGNEKKYKVPVDEENKKNNFLCH